MKSRFFKCSHCGQIVTLLKETNVPLVCCGEQMKELIPGTVDAAREKHIPEYEVINNVVYVQIGSVLHPMIPEHFIEWVVLETTKGTQIKHLVPNTEPKVTFTIDSEEEVSAVFAYCNLHGLWVK